MRDVSGETYYYVSNYNVYTISDNTFGTWSSDCGLGVVVLILLAWFAVYRGFGGSRTETR